MTIFIAVVGTLFLFIISFIGLGILTNKRNSKKDKNDLLKYLIKHKNCASITIKEDGLDTLALNSDKRFPLASTIKIIIAYKLVKLAEIGQLTLTDKIKMNDLDKFYIENTDGGAHPRWKMSIGNPDEASLLEVAKGMMQFSSNACTDYLIGKIGIERINVSLNELRVDNHDKITFLTPSVLIPGYLSDKKKIAAEKIKSLNLYSYQKLSEKLFLKMAKVNCQTLKDKVPKMLDHKIQLATTKKYASSTTREYADLMFKLGKDLLTAKEKKLFSKIVLGDNIRDNQDDLFWYKGGATLFVLTSALYKESQGQTICVSFFLEDDKGGELYWIKNILNSFVIGIAKDIDFREKVKKELSE
ncbi:hypothetical protein CFK37_17890 [Virgibacillus phasianinus]|uniref:Beta-lactamase class A catalytic domain-containing protein n=1 Tax=Virgibacillus phasianinus TaxID=2017483 RepID=A0A220U7M6_9BACI|nr:serine hydrolase [Virgibacillus phasianinus]ASK63896.1 hypothetical protein CFK37_17890 [Virgibacillus phasianinus]